MLQFTHPFFMCRNSCGVTWPLPNRKQQPRDAVCDSHGLCHCSALVKWTNVCIITFLVRLGRYCSVMNIPPFRYLLGVRCSFYSRLILHGWHSSHSVKRWTSRFSWAHCGQSRDFLWRFSDFLNTFYVLFFFKCLLTINWLQLKIILSLINLQLFPAD